MNRSVRMLTVAVFALSLSLSASSASAQPVSDPLTPTKAKVIAKIVKLLRPLVPTILGDRPHPPIP